MKLRYVVMNAAAILVCAMGVHEYKSGVREQRAEVRALVAERDAYRASVATLRNEVAYLERPERLRELAGLYLGLAPAAPSQVVGVEDAGVVLAQIRHRHGDRPIILTGGSAASMTMVSVGGAR